MEKPPVKILIFKAKFHHKTSKNKREPLGLVKRLTKKVEKVEKYIKKPLKTNQVEYKVIYGF